MFLGCEERSIMDEVIQASMRATGDPVCICMYMKQPMMREITAFLLTFDFSSFLIDFEILQ